MRKEEPERRDRRLTTMLLRAVTRISSRRPRLTLGTLVILAFAAVALTVARLEFHPERAELIDPGATLRERWGRLTERSADTRDVVAVVEAERTTEIVEALEALGARVGRETQKFSHVLYKFDAGPLQSKGLQYLSTSELDAGLRRLDRFAAAFQGQSDVLRVEPMASRLQVQLAMTAPGASDTRRSLLDQADRLGDSLLSAFGEPRDFLPPWQDLVSDRRGRRVGGQTIYLMSDDGDAGFVKALLASSPRTAEGAEAIEWLRAQAAEITESRPGVRISLTGVPVLEYDELRRSQGDLAWASLIAMAGLAIVLVVGFRGVRHPSLVLVTLLFGMAFSFGYMTLAVGHLNIFSISFVVILAGLGSNYSIVYLERYLELRHDGKLLRPALLEAVTDVGPGLITESATTALACFCALLTPYLGIAELGLIAGGGILLCLATTFLAFPALIALSDQQLTARQLPKPFSAHALRWASTRYPLVTTVVSMAVVAGVALSSLTIRNSRIEPRVHYDCNLLNLQAEDSDSVQVHKRIFGEGGESLLYAVSTADSLDAARALRAKFEALPTVDHVEDVSSLLPGGASAQKRQLIQAYRSRLAYLQGRPVRAVAGDPASVGRALERLYVQLRDAGDAESLAASRSLDAFLNRFEKLSLGEQRQFLATYQQRVADSISTEIRTASAATNLEPVSMSELPRALASRYVSAEGKWILHIFPKQEVWAQEPLARFVSALRQVDPNVSGAPVEQFEASRQIRKSYETTAVYALAAIWLLLLVDFLGAEHRLVALVPPLLIVGFIHLTMHARRGTTDVLWLVAWYIAMVTAIAAVVDFRNLRHAAIALLPPLFGGGMMFGILAWLHVPMNPVNLFVLPLLVGIGVDVGVHVVHDYRRQSGEYQPSAGTLNAIVLTSLATMVGFGSLMVAAHRGLYSLGLVLTVGVACTLFVALVPLPALLALITRAPRAAAQSGADHKGREQKPQQTAPQERRRAA